MLNLNLNVRVVCRDILPRLLTGYYICLERPLLMILRSCYLETLECTPTLAGAKKQFYLFECAVRILDSASDVILAIALQEHHPKHCELKATSTRKGDSDCEANVVGYRRHTVKGQQVYMLLVNPGIHNNMGYFFVLHHNQPNSPINCGGLS